MCLSPCNCFVWYQLKWVVIHILFSRVLHPCCRHSFLFELKTSSTATSTPRDVLVVSPGFSRNNLVVKVNLISYSFFYSNVTVTHFWFMHNSQKTKEHISRWARLHAMDSNVTLLILNVNLILWLFVFSSATAILFHWMVEWRETHWAHLEMCMSWCNEFTRFDFDVTPNHILNFVLL